EFLMMHQIHWLECFKIHLKTSLDRYNAQDMYRELLKCAEDGEISSEEVPKLATIQNWITKTTFEHQEQAVLKVMNENALNLA
ncbi:14871_t:CDS:1, partial [Dentiscutata heterogama]